MSVVPLTLAISLLLVVTFVIFFLRQHSRGAASSPERDSLLPFEEERPRAVADKKTTGDRRRETDSHRQNADSGPLTPVH